MKCDINNENNKHNCDQHTDKKQIINNDLFDDVWDVMDNRSNNINNGNNINNVNLIIPINDTNNNNDDWDAILEIHEITENQKKIPTNAKDQIKLCEPNNNQIIGRTKPYIKKPSKKIIKKNNKFDDFVDDYDINYDCYYN